MINFDVLSALNDEFVIFLILTYVCYGLDFVYVLVLIRLVMDL